MKTLHVSLWLACTLAAACSPLEGDLCDDKCDCQGCSDREYDDCRYGYDDRYEKADRRGCLDLYDDWLDCQDDTAACRGGWWETSCKFEK